MTWLTEFLKSTIGSKWLMAITGAGWVLFLIAHMLANVQVYAGPDGVNAYAASLREIPALLWGARALLALGILFHIVLALRLRAMSYKARPDRYVKRRYRRANLASRSMLLSGLILLSFLIYHLLHYTLFITHPNFGDLTDVSGRHDVYNMIVLGFTSPIIAVFYIISVALVCLHLWHGVPALFQTFGLRHPKYTPIVNNVGIALAVILFVGFALVPIGVQAGWLAPVGGGF